MIPRILALGLLVSCVSARSAELITIEDFARSPLYSELQLSPDGRYCASLREVNKRNYIEFVDLAGATVQKFDPGYSTNSRNPGAVQRDVLQYRWLGSKRVLANLTDGTAAFDRNGANWKPISGPLAVVKQLRGDFTSRIAGLGSTKENLAAREVIFTFDDDVHALMLKHPFQARTASLYPEVINMNTETGTYETVVTNPGDVISWIADRKGVVRAGIRLKSIKDISLIYREGEKSPWREFTPLASHNEPPALHGFSADGKGVYFSATDSSGYRVLYLCNLATGEMGEPLLAAPGYDVGLSSGALWSDYKQAVVGFAYSTEGPHIKCFDEEFARNLAEIDSLLPNTFNRPVSISDHDLRILVFASSDRNPGAYYLYLTDNKKLEPILRPRPWIKLDSMAPMNPITYTTRDGLEIHGYLTIPLGQKPRNLPLVVLPHNGTFVFRDKWDFDPLVQMLANRGYAVLQMNYRGSPGYGEAFAKKGEQEVGSAIQQDIEDATRWAIAKKVADPKRIAIVGTNRFSGFSALYALGKSPDLYCCGITMFGIIDWFDLYTHLDDLDGRTAEFSRQEMIKEIGDPQSNSEKFKAISPVNFLDKITEPVLFIHRTIDYVVPPEHVRKMVAALKKAGGKPEALFVEVEEGIKGRESAKIQDFKAIEAFLAKHLGPGATAPVDAPVVSK